MPGKNFVTPAPPLWSTYGPMRLYWQAQARHKSWQAQVIEAPQHNIMQPAADKLHLTPNTQDVCNAVGTVGRYAVGLP